MIGGFATNAVMSLKESIGEYWDFQIRAAQGSACSVLLFLEYSMYVSILFIYYRELCIMSRKYTKFILESSIIGFLKQIMHVNIALACSNI